MLLCSRIQVLINVKYDTGFVYVGCITYLICGVTNLFHPANISAGGVYAFPLFQLLSIYKSIYILKKK